MDRDQKADARHQARHNLGRLLRGIRVDADFSSQTSLAQELKRLDVTDEKTVGTWAKTISNAETGGGRPHRLHLDWCGEHTSQIDELRQQVRSTAEICRWHSLLDWGVSGDRRLQGFTGLRHLLDKSCFSYDVQAIEPTHILWLHRLRSPHLIHGVFALAAAGALRSGLSVQLILDDTQPIEGEPEFLLEEWDVALNHWMGRVGLDSGQLQVRRFTSALAMARENVDLWAALTRFLSSATLVQYLRAAKAVPLSITSANDPVVVLPEGKALRLLTPIYNWIVLEHEAKQLLNDDPNAAVITLGGADEQILWDRWRLTGPPADIRRSIGHVYLARMPVPRPPWDYRTLAWRGRRMHNGGLGALFDAVAEETDPPREAIADLAEWLYKAGITLPLELELPKLWPYAERTGQSVEDDVRRSAINEPRSVARALADGIGSWFYS